MSMSQQDWVIFAEGVIAMAAIFLASLYFLEYHGSLKKAHAAIWKKPKRWQLITLCALWSFIVAGVILLVCIHRPN
jgi:hypothetical protein